MIVLTKSETGDISNEAPLLKSQNNFRSQTLKPQQLTLENQFIDKISENSGTEPDDMDEIIVSLELRIKELETQHQNKIKELNKDYESNLNTLIIQNQRLKFNLATSEQHNEELTLQVRILNEKLNSFEKDSQKTLAKSFTTFDDLEYSKSHTKSDMSNFSVRTESFRKNKDNKLQGFNTHRASTKVESKKSISKSLSLGGTFTSKHNTKLLNLSDLKVDESFHHNLSNLKPINEPIISERSWQSDTFSGSNNKLVSDKSYSKANIMEALFKKNNKNLQDNTHFIKGLTENLSMSTNDKSLIKNDELASTPTLGHSSGSIMKHSAGYMPLAHYFSNYISNDVKK